MSIAGWLPTDWPKAILPLAIRAGESFVSVGTAFLIDHEGLNCLVTAKHVIREESGKPRSGLYVLSNRVGGGGNFLSLDEMAAAFGISWKTVGSDIAATLMPADNTYDIKKFSIDLFESFSNIREGDDVFILGFPLKLGVSASARITPIVRTGIVALRNDDRSFLVDANVFPGNSGSPVFFKPCAFEFGSSGLRLGTLRPPKLIGLVTSFITYTDVAISQQTGKARVTFEENSGLASALSVELIREVLNSSDFQAMTRAIIERERRSQPS